MFILVFLIKAKIYGVSWCTLPYWFINYILWTLFHLKYIHTSISSKPTHTYIPALQCVNWQRVFEELPGQQTAGWFTCSIGKAFNWPFLPKVQILVTVSHLWLVIISPVVVEAWWALALNCYMVAWWACAFVLRENWVEPFFSKSQFLLLL